MDCHAVSQGNSSFGDAVMLTYSYYVICCLYQLVEN